jgi:hypothetical protein
MFCTTRKVAAARPNPATVSVSSLEVPSVDDQTNRTSAGAIAPRVA